MVCRLMRFANCTSFQSRHLTEKRSPLENDRRKVEASAGLKCGNLIRRKIGCVEIFVAIGPWTESSA